MSRRNAQTLIEHSSTRISLLNRKREIFYATPATNQLLGYDGELIGKLLLDGVHPDDKSEVGQMLDLLYSQPGSTHQAVFRFTCRDGTYHWISANATNLLNDQQVTGVVMVWDDINELKQAKRELAERDRVKDEFLAVVAHELRSPLAAIKNSAYLLKLNGNSEAVLRECIDMIDRQTDMIMHLTSDLLDLASIDHGKKIVNPVPMLLEESMCKAVASVKPLMQKRRHNLTISYPPQPVAMNADPVRMEQILTNLLTNAAKYTDEGGKIDFTATLVGDRITIRVTDSGIGIPSHKLARIFEIFHQEDNKRGGLGIGLTLVKKLVELHNGTIEASSLGVGCGSSFAISLPLVDQDRQKQATHRVLIVEDNADSANSLGRLIKHFGHEVKVVICGRCAIDAYKEFKPSVVLSDINLSDMDGYEVAQQIRKTDPKAMIVAVTALSLPADIRKALTSGFDLHFSKPVNPSELQQFLSKQIGLQHKKSSLECLEGELA